MGKCVLYMVTFLWSLFLGPAGADYFYLGFPVWGFAKLSTVGLLGLWWLTDAWLIAKRITVGGLGLWWLTDIVCIASGPVYASNYRTLGIPDMPYPVQRRASHQTLQSPSYHPIPHLPSNNITCCMECGDMYS